MDNKTIIFSAADAISMFCRLNINIKKDIPIRSSHMGLLILVAKAESSITPVDAAKFFNVKKPMITAMVKSLETDGYITRQASTHDKRSYTISPTKKASKIVHETYNEYFKVITKLQKALGESDFLSFVSLLEKSNQVLSKEKTE